MQKEKRNGRESSSLHLQSGHLGNALLENLSLLLPGSTGASVLPSAHHLSDLTHRTLGAPFFACSPWTAGAKRLKVVLVKASSASLTSSMVMYPNSWITVERGWITENATALRERVSKC